jgi:hypothetical protein
VRVSPHFGSLARVAGQRIDLLPKAAYDLFSGTEGDRYPSVGFDQFARSTIVDHDWCQAQRHSFENGATAEFPNAREQENLAFAGDNLDLIVRDPSMEMNPVGNSLPDG